MTPDARRQTPDVVRDILHPGQGWSRVLGRHQALTLTDTTGRACVGLLAYAARQPLERYNMPDSLKAQYTAFLTTGRVLMSDMGRVLLAITEDTCGWHDTLTGHGTQAEVDARWGVTTYQHQRNERYRGTRENFLIELAKYDLGRADLHANANLFAKVVTDEQGAFAFVPSNSRPGARVTLRSELEVLVVLSNTPHPLDPSPTYPCGPVELEIRDVPPPGPEDPCRIKRDENRRAYQMTEGSLP